MKSLSLYIHIPFCSRTCPYCTFYHTARSPELERAYVRRAVEEIGAEFGAIEERHPGNDSAGAPPPVRLNTIYAGGGTPSILPEASMRELLQPLATRLEHDAIEERTIELNPEDISGGRLDALKDMAFNRVSVGVQSMSRRAQQVLGRCGTHVNQLALESVQSRFENYNVDLLVGIPGGSVEEVVSSGKELLQYSPKHVSVYCLEGSGEISNRVRDFLSRIDQEKAASEYLALCELFENRGYIHYEVSNFALPGFESKHNLAYWEGGDYLGIGPAAHSFIGGIRWFNRPSLESYLAVQGSDFTSVRTIDTPGEQERYLERLFLGLRTNRGVAIDSINYEQRVVDTLAANGLARIFDERLILSDRGFLVLDEIVLRLVGTGHGRSPAREF